VSAAPRRGSARRGVLRPFVAVLAVGLGLGVALAACGDEPPAGEHTASPVEGYEYEACFDEVGRADVGEQFGETRIRIESDAGEGSTCAAVADTAQQRAQGLMGVEDLGGFGGMLFVFEVETMGAFHMEDTPTPLSIAWFATDGSLVSTADMEPCLDQPDCPTYSPDGLYRYALEVPQGELENLAIEPGDDSARLIVD
jgi:uncharacterized membrane protein (UPF0127 family)